MIHIEHDDLKIEGPLGDIMAECMVILSEVYTIMKQEVDEDISAEAFIEMMLPAFLTDEEMEEFMKNYLEEEEEGYKVTQYRLLENDGSVLLS